MGVIEIEVPLHLIFRENIQNTGIQYLQSSWSRNPYYTGKNYTIGQLITEWRDDWGIVLNQKIRMWRGSLIRPQFVVIDKKDLWGSTFNLI